MHFVDRSLVKGFLLVQHVLLRINDLEGVSTSLRFALQWPERNHRLAIKKNRLKVSPQGPHHLWKAVISHRHVPAR